MQVASTATCETTSTSPVHDTAHHTAAMIPIEQEHAAPNPSMAGSAVQLLATMDSVLDLLFGRSEEENTRNDREEDETQALNALLAGAGPGRAWLAKRWTQLNYEVLPPVLSPDASAADRGWENSVPTYGSGDVPGELGRM